MDSVAEFAQRIKTKYPDYAEVPDEELVTRILDKHPDYRPMVDLGNTDNGGQAGGMGDVKMAESPAGAPQPSKEWLGYYGPRPNPEALAAVPRFAGDVGKSLSTGIINAAAQGTQDNWGHPLDILAGIAGDELKNVASPFHTFETPIQSTATSLERAGVPNAPQPPPMRYPGEVFPGGDAPIPGLAEQAGTTADMFTPLFGGNVLAKTLSYIPGIVKAAGGGVGFINKQAGSMASELSGVPEEALRAYGDPIQRAQMAANYGKEQEIGSDLLHRIERPDAYLPERAIVDQGLEKMPNLPIQPAIDAMAAAKGARVAGRLSPEKAAANAGIDKYIDFLRGGPAPEDLGVTAQDAMRALGDARAESGATGAIAATDTKAATQAERAQQTAQTAAARAASKAGSLKKQFINTVDQIESSPRYGRVIQDGKVVDLRPLRNELGETAGSALEDAQSAAAKAKAISTEARAKLAVGQISQADYEAAQAAEAEAARNVLVTGSARKLSNGQPIGEVARDLSKNHGIKVDELRDILKDARAKAESGPKLPPQTVTAIEYRKLRQDLDVPVKWDEEGGAIKNSALKAGRTTMKNELLKAAAASGDPQYAKAMESWSDKLDKLDRIKGLLGKTGSARDKRVEQFINNLFGKNSAYKQQLMNDLDHIFQSDIVGRAKAADMAASLGEGGKPAILPRQVTGASLKAGLLANLVPGVGQIAAIGTASPRVAASLTLPVLTKMEQGIKAAGIAMTPRAAGALQALKGPISAAQRARLATLLATELEASLPPNAIPFRQKVAEQDQPTEYVTRR
jgi:hypothetical protein